MPASTRLALLGLADGKGTGLHVARDTCDLWCEMPVCVLVASRVGRALCCIQWRVVGSQ